MGCKILKRVTWPWPRPFQGRFFIGRVGLAMVSQCTKFEVSRFTRYETMNGGAKCRKWNGLGHSRSSAMSPFDRAHTISYSTLIETMRLSCTVFEKQPVIYRKLPILTHPNCIWRARWGWPRSNFAEIFGVRKLESLIIVWFCLCFSRTPTCDRQTDLQTGRHRAMASTADPWHRGVKNHFTIVWNQTVILQSVMSAMVE